MDQRGRKILQNRTLAVVVRRDLVHDIVEQVQVEELREGARPCMAGDKFFFRCQIAVGDALNVRAPSRIGYVWMLLKITRQSID